MILKPQDRIFLYTDGVTEALNDAQQLYSEERLLQFISVQPQDISSEELSQKVVQSVNEYAQSQPQADDITVLSLRILG
jgi:sigma-B regulation protein RsbU (phosphoserine phosphatase)